MSKFDQEGEELIKLLYSILNYARLGYEISTFDNCNNCGKTFCEYRPPWWKTVRWNCPLWKGEENERTD